MKRSLSLLTLIALLAAMLAACGGAPAAQPTTAPAEPTAAPAEPTAAPAAEPTAAATEPAPAAGGTIKIATQSPLSGPQSVLGTSIQQSAELAVAQLVDDLEALGFTVELAPFDDQAQPEVGSANAKAIVSDPDILCMVGHLNSGVALAALPDYQNASLAMVSPANTNPRVTESGYENAFRIVGRDDLQGPIGARFAAENLDASSVYIIHDTTEYGQGVAEFFRQEAEKLGLTIAGFEGTQEQAVFDSLITPILATNPDVVYFGGLYSQAGPFFQQARERGVTAQFLGPDGLDSSELANLAGDALEGTYYTTVAAPVTFFPDAATFASDYQTEFGEPVQPFGAQAFDAAGICISAITTAAEAAGGKPTREQVLAAMQNLEPYTGITGVYTFTEKGDPTEAAYYILAANTDPALWNENELSAQINSAPPGSAPAAGGATGGDAQTITDYVTELAGQLDGVDLGTIKIATQSPLSGPQSVLGSSIGNSASLGVTQFGALLTGGTFEVAPFDDQAQPEVGSANAKAIVSDPDILCVVGHLNSGVALAALPDYQNASLAMVSPANTNPRITESGYENAFRIVGRDDLQGPIGARFAAENLDASSVYIIHDTTEYGQGVAEFFRQEAEKLGLTIAGFEGTQEQAVFDSLITPILATNPDVVYFGGIYSQAGPFFQQARERGVTAQFLGPDGLDSSELANLAGDALEGTYYTTVAAPVTFFPDAATFASDYQTEFGEAVQPFGAQAFDAAGLCMAAIAKAAVDAGAKPTREQVLAAMQDLPALAGITGVYTFTEKGDPTEAAYYILAANTDPALWNENELSAQINSAPPAE